LIVVAEALFASEALLPLGEGADDTAFVEVFDLFGREPGLSEHCAGVAAEWWRCPLNRSRRRGHFEERANDALRPGYLVHDVMHDPFCLHDWIVSHEFREIDRCGRDSTRVKCVNPLGNGSLKQDLLNLAFHRCHLRDDLGCS